MTVLKKTLLLARRKITGKRRTIASLKIVMIIVMIIVIVVVSIRVIRLHLEVNSCFTNQRLF